MSEIFKPDELLNLQNYASMNELCRKYRGIILHNVTGTEHHIDHILLGYFKPEHKKSYEFHHTLLNSEFIQLSTKWKVTHNLLKLHFPVLYKFLNIDAVERSKGKFKYLNEKSDINKKINNQIEHRNVFAHRMFLPGTEEVNAFDGKTINLKTLKLQDGIWSDDHHLPLTLDEDYILDLKLEASFISLYLLYLTFYVEQGTDIEETDFKKIAGELEEGVNSAIKKVNEVGI